VAPASGLKLVLLPQSSLAGTVVARQSGETVPGLRVVARNIDGLELPRTEEESDALGRFEFRRLPAGSYSLEAKGEDFQGALTGVQLGLGHRLEGLRLVVDPAASLEGEVLVEGKPCKRGQLLLISGRNRGITALDEQGRGQVLGLVPGEYEAVASCEGARSDYGRLRLGAHRPRG
jgi:hypothetical protein